MPFFRSLRPATVRILLPAVSFAGLTIAVLMLQHPAAGQSRGRNNPEANVKELDLQAEKVRAEFLRGSVELATEYEKAGELEKAKTVLSTILKLQPDAKGVKAKIDSLDNELIVSNPLELEVDTGRGWTAVGVRVFGDQPFRIQSSGKYRFVSNGLVGPEGFPTAEPAAGDMAVGIPCGALMGVILSPDKKGLKPGAPFAVGTETDIKPKADGLLYLRVNTPPGSKCSGRIKVLLTGYVRSTK
ncbi:MAG: hypothetical protein KDA79_03950 [Planctomycetaceae bacterium]|nr:hypothetical protein [Planctomycetaceae bacterium]